MTELDDLVFCPLTTANWADFEAFFQSDPTCNGCWCMWWRKTRSKFQGHARENKAEMHAIVDSGVVPGLLAYRNGQVVAWCSVAPRNQFPSLNRSPTLKPVDDKPVWSIVCFVVAEPLRRKGMTQVLTREAIRYAKDRGAEIIEAYPLINREKRDSLSGNTYMGLASTFEALGFRQVSSRSDVRNIMRLFL